jgi:hypothetical protein
MKATYYFQKKKKKIALEKNVNLKLSKEKKMDKGYEGLTKLISKNFKVFELVVWP